MDKFKNNVTSEQVHITQKGDDFFILSNGLQISSDDFIRNYTPVTSSDPGELYNQIQKNKNLLEQKMTTVMNKTKNPNVVNQVEEVDPNAFFDSSAKRLLQESKKLDSIDPAKVKDPPKGYGTIVRDLTAENEGYNIDDLEERKRIAAQQYNAAVEGTGQPKIPVAARLSDKDLNKFKQMDENDPNAGTALINQPPMKGQTGNIDPETGLDERQTVIRKKQMDATGEDPYAERVIEWKAKRGKVIDYPKKTSSAIPKLDQSVYNTDPSNTSSDTDIMTMILSKFKKNYEVKISFSIDEKIPNPEFLKMATENIDGDVVDHYTEEFMKKFLSNIPDLRDTIYKQIYKEVYGIALEEKKKVKSSKKETKEEKLKVNEVQVDETSVEKPVKKPAKSKKK